jgi:hypothetical protein
MVVVAFVVTTLLIARLTDSSRSARVVPADSAPTSPPPSTSEAFDLPSTVTTLPNSSGAQITAAVTAHCHCAYDGDPFSFEITLTGAQPSETIAFTLIGPTGARDTRFPRTASADGTVETSWLSHDSDANGYWIFQADGNHGTRASLILHRSEAGLSKVPDGAA